MHLMSAPEVSSSGIQSHSHYTTHDQSLLLHCRTRQTFVGVRQAFPDENFAGVQVGSSHWEQSAGSLCLVVPRLAGAGMLHGII